jgi:L-lactate dehydrogenase complex protein LldE
MIKRPHYIAVFATCLVDLMRPSVGFATIKLLEDAGCIIDVPPQTCCGQPAYNSGDKKTAKTLAEQMIAAFEKYEAVVVPSGSCAGMVIKHYPELFANDPNLKSRAERLAAKTHELTSFLVDILGVSSVQGSLHSSLTYHDSCSGLRELDVKLQPRKLLKSLTGLELKELADSETCCGFGGTFCVKYPDVSEKIVSKKTENIALSEASILAAGDLGCLMNMAGRLSREGKSTRVFHVAEVLAGMTDQPAIGEAYAKS